MSQRVALFQSLCVSPSDTLAHYFRSSLPFFFIIFFLRGLRSFLLYSGGVSLHFVRITELLLRQHWSEVAGRA